MKSFGIVVLLLVIIVLGFLMVNEYQTTMSNMKPCNIEGLEVKSNNCENLTEKQIDEFKTGNFSGTSSSQKSAFNITINL